MISSTGSNGFFLKNQPTTLGEEIFIFGKQNLNNLRKKLSRKGVYIAKIYARQIIIFFFHLKQGSPHSRPASPNNELRLVHKEELSPNAKVAILEDIDNDGVEELIIGYTDRYVRIYKWSVQGLFVTFHIFETNILFFKSLISKKSAFG